MRTCPMGGLAFGALHEIAPAAAGDLPAAFGFMAALLGRMPPRRPVLLVPRAAASRTAAARTATASTRSASIRPA